MTYVITEACIDVKDRACMEACPPMCIYEGGRMMYIQPDECIDCALCLSVCPVDAIYDEADLPERFRPWLDVNKDFFGPQVTAWGAPGGASPEFTTTRDHPAVAAAPVRAVPEPGG